MMNKSYLESSNNDSLESVGLDRSIKGQSLLDRIRAQQQQRQQQQQQHQILQQHGHESKQSYNMSVSMPVQYDPGMDEETCNTNMKNSSMEIFSNAWSNLRGTSFGSNDFGLPNNTHPMNEALLLSQDDSTSNDFFYNGTGDYSITKYFVTFIMDIYGLFNRLPLPVRWIVVLLLIFVGFKLL